MTQPATSATWDQTLDADFHRSRVGLYLQVLFLIHIGFFVVSAVLYALGLQLPGATAPTLLQQALEPLVAVGLGAGWWLVSRGCPPRRVVNALDAVVPPLLGMLYVRLVAGSGVPDAGLLILILVGRSRPARHSVPTRSDPPSAPGAWARSIERVIRA